MQGNRKIPWLCDSRSYLTISIMESVWRLHNAANISERKNEIVVATFSIQLVRNSWTNNTLVDIACLRRDNVLFAGKAYYTAGYKRVRT